MTEKFLATDDNFCIPLNLCQMNAFDLILGVEYFENSVVLWLKSRIKKL